MKGMWMKNGMRSALMTNHGECGAREINTIVGPATRYRSHVAMTSIKIDKEESHSSLFWTRQNMLDRAFVCAQCTARLTRRPIFRAKTSLFYSASRHLSNNAIPDRPVRVAIVGSGPAGFYAASRLLNKQQDAVVDMYEKLPVPFGLARYGVAPDHPEVKVCAR
jgi:hypothetical protein